MVAYQTVNGLFPQRRGHCVPLRSWETWHHFNTSQAEGQLYPLWQLCFTQCGSAPQEFCRKTSSRAELFLSWICHLNFKMNTPWIRTSDLWHGSTIQWQPFKKTSRNSSMLLCAFPRNHWETLGVSFLSSFWVTHVECRVAFCVTGEKVEKDYKFNKGWETSGKGDEMVSDT